MYLPAVRCHHVSPSPAGVEKQPMKQTASTHAVVGITSEAWIQLEWVVSWRRPGKASEEGQFYQMVKTRLYKWLIGIVPPICSPENMSVPSEIIDDGWLVMVKPPQLRFKTKRAIYCRSERAPDQTAFR